MENTEKENKYFRAKARVEEIGKFYSNLSMYVVFISFLAFINYWTNEWSYPWFLWAAFGWGIGVVFQAIKVYRGNLFFGKNWEERKIKEFMEGDDKTHKWE